MKKLFLLTLPFIYFTEVQAYVCSSESLNGELHFFLDRQELEYHRENHDPQIYSFSNYFVEDAATADIHTINIDGVIRASINETRLDIGGLPPNRPGTAHINTGSGFRNIELDCVPFSTNTSSEEPFDLIEPTEEPQAQASSQSADPYICSSDQLGNNTHFVNLHTRELTIVSSDTGERTTYPFETITSHPTEMCCDVPPNNYVNSTENRITISSNSRLVLTQNPPDYYTANGTYYLTRDGRHIEISMSCHRPNIDWIPPTTNREGSLPSNSGALK